MRAVIVVAVVALGILAVDAAVAQVGTGQCNTTCNTIGQTETCTTRCYSSDGSVTTCVRTCNTVGGSTYCSTNCF